MKVGGWGVEMVLKKMEYSSVDDRAKTGGDGSNEEKGELDVLSLLLSDLGWDLGATCGLQSFMF